VAQRDEAAAKGKGATVKWILVTTNPAPHMPGTNHPHGDGWNVGDCFARLGTQQLVLEVDPDAEIALVNMDDPKTYQNAQPFDRAIFAGRPMFWEGCETHPLWHDLINGWLCAEPRRVMALGVGTCYRSHRRDSANLANYFPRVEEALGKMWRVVMRHPSPFPQVIASVCPASWVIAGSRPPNPGTGYRLANFMPGGGHYAALCEFEAAHWNSIEGTIARTLIEDGFAAVAHTVREEEHARKLGFERVFRFDDVFEYLGLYEQAELYFGNRMHGAVILAGTEAAAFAVGYDSRLGMVTHAGQRGCFPSQLRIDELRWFAGYRPTWRDRVRAERIQSEKRNMIRLLEEFAKNAP
jgi:hypothetical protein